MAEIPTNIKELFLDLDFIAGTPEEHKPGVKERTYDNDNSWLGWLGRKRRGDNQEGTLNFLDDLVSRTIKAFQQRSSEAYYPILLNKSIAMRAGLVTIKTSYSTGQALTRSQRKINGMILSLDYALNPEQRSEYKIPNPAHQESSPT